MKYTSSSFHSQTPPKMGFGDGYHTQQNFPVDRNQYMDQNYLTWTVQRNSILDGVKVSKI